MTNICHFVFDSSIYTHVYNTRMNDQFMAKLSRSDLYIFDDVEECVLNSDQNLWSCGLELLLNSASETEVLWHFRFT